MVSRLILGTTISLALVLCPFLVTDTHAKSRKSSHIAVKGSRSYERSKPRVPPRAAITAAATQVAAIRATAETMITNRPTAVTAVRTVVRRVTALIPPNIIGRELLKPVRL